MASKACAVSPGPSSRIPGSDRRRPHHGCGPRPRPSATPLRHVETAEALGLLVGHVHTVDLRPPRAPADEAPHRLDRLSRALHDDLDRAVVAVDRAARDAEGLSTPARRVAEEHALDTAAGDEAAADHSASVPSSPASAAGARRPSIST